MELILFWLVIANIFAFILFWEDKRRAKQKAWRIPEKVLLGVALFGGGVGSFLGMQLFRHKTKHRKFIFCIPLCIIINVIIAIGLMLKL